MQAVKLEKQGKSFTRGREFDLHPHLHAAVLHQRQFEDVEDAQPGDLPCPMK